MDVNRQEPLHLPWLFDLSDLPFFLWWSLLRQFGSVVKSIVLTVFKSELDFSFNRTAAFPLLGDDNTGNIGLPFQKLVEEKLGGFSIVSGLHQYIERRTILMHCPPKVVVLTLDGEHLRIYMSFRKCWHNLVRT